MCVHGVYLRFVSHLPSFSQVRALCLEGLCNLADADENKMRMWGGGGGNGGDGGGVLFQASPSGRQKIMLKQIRHLLVAGGARGEPTKVRTWAVRALCSLADPGNELSMWRELGCRRVLHFAAANTGESSSYS